MVTQRTLFDDLYAALEKNGISGQFTQNLMEELHMVGALEGLAE